MSNLLNKPIVLKLNANWERISYIPVHEAITALTGGIHTAPAKVVRVEETEGGEAHAVCPMGWDEWVTLDVPDGYPFINTTRGKIRCPMVIIEPNFAKMPMREPKLDRVGIYERDGYRDQYTNEICEPHELSIDHVIPRDVWRKRGLKGSPDTWENMVTCKKERNFRKGNKLNGAMGLTLIRRPKRPKAVPASFLIKQPLHKHHVPFFPPQ